MICKGCKRVVYELRGRWCWDCANNGERKVAHRTISQHLLAMIRNLFRGRWLYAKFDAQWAIGRLTHTGDYRSGGYFDRQGHFR